MKIIFFNIWHGILWEKLRDFLVTEASKTDVFCLLEVDPEVEKKLESIFPDFAPFPYAGIKTSYFNNIIEGRSMFIRKNIRIEEAGNIELFKVSRKDAGGGQFAKLSVGNKSFWIGSIHGKSRPGHKKDTPVRLKQSETIINFFNDKKGPKIIGGDFNLLPDTKSVRKIEKAGYKNLIKEFNIKTTRNQISWDKFASTPGYLKQYYADFCFVSSGVKVKNFEVPENEVSDHLPLVLEFEI